MDGIADSTAAEIRVTRFVSAFENRELFAAEGKHFRLEGHSVEMAVAVERPQNLVFASNLNPVADFVISSFCHYRYFVGSTTVLQAFIAKSSSRLSHAAVRSGHSLRESSNNIHVYRLLSRGIEEHTRIGHGQD
jgi:hypothetical protein